ncbi:alpha/beta fold hydrolase [Paenibacillus chartarius]|uniref:Alpha/beta fold hydrolase n=1 Tax=Paenibacillus chartarius TaxID=747481 RepID=A0ABV6DSY2_9BACL
MIKENKFVFHAMEFHYAECGNASGEPVLLLHGGSSRWQSFEGLIPYLSDYHVFAPDLRGHGKSDRAPDKSYRLEDYVEDIAAFIDEVIGQPPLIYGHSLGGMIALLLGAWYPERVKAILVGDSPISTEVLKEHTLGQREMTEHWRTLAAKGDASAIAAELKKISIPVAGRSDPVPASEVFGEDHVWFDFMAVSLSQNDPYMLDAINHRFDETYEAYKLPEFSKAECPVLFIQGDPEQGGLMSDQDLEKVLRIMKRAETVRVTGVGHPLHMQDPEQVFRIIDSFIRRLA